MGHYNTWKIKFMFNRQIRQKLCKRKTKIATFGQHMQPYAAATITVKGLTKLTTLVNGNPKRNNDK